MNLDPTQFGTGHIPDEHDPRDFQAVEVMAVPAIDWNTEFRLEAPPDTDQGASDACVAFSSSYLHTHLRGPVFSKRDLFSRIALGYGAYIRDGVLEIVKNGQVLETEGPDPVTPTPGNMRDASGIDTSKRAANKEISAYVLPNQALDYLAQAIREHGGFVFGLIGTNSGWFKNQDTLLVPDWPQMGSSDPTWGHALYGMGYHTHTNPDGSKEKCIIAKSSWCKYVKEHHIRERYFLTGNTNSAWVLLVKGKTVNSNVKVINVKGTIYVAVGISDPKELDVFNRIFDTQITPAADGSIPSDYQI